MSKFWRAADTVQIDDAVGLCTVAKQTTFEELLQGAGRLRKILEGQTAHFITTQELKVADILAQAKRNSQLDTEDRLFRALKQQMQNEIRSSALHKILNCRTATEALRIFNKAKHLFITTPNFDVWQMYGQKTVEIGRKDALINYLKMSQAEVQKLSIFSRKEKEELCQKLAKYRLIIDKCAFETKIKSQIINTESHSETHKELEKEIEVEVKKEIQAKPTFYPLKEQKKWPQLNLYQTGFKCDKACRSFIQQIACLACKLPAKLEVLNNYLYSKIISRNVEVDDVLTKFQIPLFKLGILLIISTNKYTFSAAILFYGLEKIAKGLIFQDKVSFYEASELLANHPDPSIKNLSSYFKPDAKKQILLTSNFMPVKDKPSFTPFNKEQKLSYKILVIKENNHFTAIMGDQTSDQASWRALLENQAVQADRSGRQIFEYDLELNTITAGASIANKELKKNLDFQLMLIKVKLLNGDTNFSKSQLKFLSYIVNSKIKAQKLYNFIKKINLHFPDKQNYFNSNPINKMLTELIA